MIHDRPCCFGCQKAVEFDPVYAPPFCEDTDCPSAVFHGICLMEHREALARHRERWEKAQEFFRQHAEEGGCDECR